MRAPTEKKSGRRTKPRNQTEAVILCRPFASDRLSGPTDGVMLNFSGGGVYIETPHEARSGTILVVRIVRFPSIWSSITIAEQPRSICLAEVRWQRKLADDATIRYGLGLRYLK